MSTRAVDINNREEKSFRAKGEGCGDGVIVDRVMGEFKELVIPSGDDTTRGTNRWFVDKRSKSGRKKGGSKKARKIRNLGLLEAEDRRQERVKSGSFEGK
jgi:hypothetical protein